MTPTEAATEAGPRTATDLSPPSVFEPYSAVAPVGPQALAVAQPWPLAKRVGFRFFACYFLLYSLGSFFGNIPLLGIVAGWYFRGMQAVTVWTGTHVLHVTGPLAVVPTGSGDTLRAFVQNFVVLSLAVIATVVWSALDRRRSEYARAYDWLAVFVRFTLAFTMLSYGFAKIVPTQMPAPGPDRWIEPLGEYSPMGLLWTFMGYSYVYEIFTGSGEALAGLLMFARRTTTAGALLAVAVMSNVVLMNYTFDVPVKLYSSNLLLMAFFLAAPDIKRLVDMLVLNRAVAPRELRPLFASRKVGRVLAVLVVLQIAFVIFGNITRGLTFYRQTSPTSPAPTLFGVYDVVEFTRNGVPVPPLMTDATRWNRVAFARLNRAVVRSSPDSAVRFTTKIDSVAKTIQFTARFDSSLKVQFKYDKPAADRLALTGRIGTDSVVAILRRVDDKRFLLVSRGYNWIQEQPFNR